MTNSSAGIDLGSSIAAESDRPAGWGDAIEVSALTGLSEADVQERRRRGESHFEPTRSSRTYLEIVRDNLLTFINVTLVTIGAVLIAMGQVNDAIMASGLAVLNATSGVIQELIAKRRLDRIALLTRARATVVRESTERNIDPNEIVIGDLLKFGPGDQFVVDGHVIAESQVEVDESLLTGESNAIEKDPGDLLQSGTYCLSGSGYYIAERVGVESTAARIATGARAYRRKLTPLQRSVNLIVRLLLGMAAFFLGLVILGGLLHDYPFQDTVLAAAVVLGIVPSGLFLMITITYSMAAIRLADRNALIQQTNAIESLSNVDVFCMDKTGTLTTNRLELVEVRSLVDSWSEQRLRALLGAMAASASSRNKTSEAIAAGCPAESRRVAGEIPFSSERKWSAIAFADQALPGGFVLGAAEFISPPARRLTWPSTPTEWTERGLRVLMLARTPTSEFVTGTRDEQLPDDLQPLAWIVLRDELRPNVDRALEQFRRANVELKIISGDHAGTVAALARQVGLSSHAVSRAGFELDAMSDAEFAAAVEETTIFGRISPEQKRRIVDQLRSNGHYVAMTGDGVNDVLSLKAADLGIALESGSQATRGAADIVLLADTFEAVPLAFAEGQRIRRGLQGILYLFLSRVFVVAAIITAVVFVQLGFPFTPGHMTLLTLLTVGIPTFCLAIWTLPGPVEPHFARAMARFLIPVTVLLTATAFSIYLFYYVWYDVPSGNTPRGGVPGMLQTGAGKAEFARDALTYVLVLAGVWLVIFAAPPNRFWAVVEPLAGTRRPAIAALAMLPLYALIMLTPGLRGFFGVHLLGWGDYLLIAAAVVVWAFLQRAIWQHRIVDRLIGIDLSPGWSGERSSRPPTVVARTTPADRMMPLD